MGQSVCITGASRGLGLGLTEHYLAKGCQVLAIARKSTEKPQLQALAKKYGNQLEVFDADVTDYESLTPLKKRWENGTLDLLINNAGILADRGRDFHQLNLGQLRESFEVNVVAPVALTQMAIPALKNSSSAKLVMMSSLMGSLTDNSSGGYYAYRSSKTALNMVVRSLTKDFPWLTTVAMHPGWVQTDMGGEAAPTTIPESVAGMTAVIEGLKVKESGQFRDFKGAVLAW